MPIDLGDIERERASWGDPIDVIPDISVSIGGESLWAFKYANGETEFIPESQVNQCSSNTGGDPASGCDTIINPHAPDMLCAQHREWYLRCIS